MILAAILAGALALAQPQAPGFDELSRQAAGAREANRTADAVRLYRQALKLRPGWDEGVWYLATVLYDQEKFGESRDLLRQFVMRMPQTGPGWALLGMSEYHTREYARSLDHLQHGLALKLTGREAMTRSAWYLTGALLTRASRFDESRAVLLDIRRAGPVTPAIVEAAGLAVLRLPLLPSEIAPERRALIEAAGRGACALATAGGQTEGIALLKQLASDYPTEPGVHFLLGAALIESDAEAGVAEMRKELEVSPNHTAALVRLAQQYLQEDKQDLALGSAKQAVTADPDAWLARLALGEVLLRKREWTGAIAELEAARRLAPDFARIHWALSRAYAAVGRKDEARRESERVQAIEEADK